MVFLTPSVSFASWWNPLSWFEKEVKTEILLENSSSTESIILETETKSNWWNPFTWNKKENNIKQEIPSEQEQATTTEEIIPKENKKTALELEIAKAEAEAEKYKLETENARLEMEKLKQENVLNTQTQTQVEVKKEENKNTTITLPNGSIVEMDENGNIVKTLKEAQQPVYTTPTSTISSQNTPSPAMISAQPTCTTNWQCNTWTTCTNSQQIRTCNDLNNCGALIGKPSVLQSCTVICAPNWQTGSWTTCTNSQQTRIATDSNNCGTATGKPSETQSCTTPLSISLSTITTKDVSAHIAWNTNIPSYSKVFLTQDDGSVQTIQSVSGYSTQHFVDISGLKFSTQYSYTIESINGVEVKKLTDTILTQPEEFSDFVFNNTSPAVGSATQWKAKISIAQTIRDIQIRKAVFKFSDEDAVRLDAMQPCMGDVPFVFSYLLNAQSEHPVAFDIVKIDKNTYVFKSLGYPYSSAGGISIPQNTSRPLTLSLCADTTLFYEEIDSEVSANRALMENMNVSMSEWEIWDQSNGKRVNIQ